MKDLRSLFVFETPERQREVVESLGQHLRLREERVERRTLLYYDTFDWRLYKASSLLALSRGPRDPASMPSRRASDESVLVWQGLDGSLRHRWPTEEVPGFAWDFPAGVLRDDLEKVLSMRRLLPVAELEIKTSSFRVLNKDDKTVVRILLEDRTARPADGAGERVELPSQLRLRGLRGYDAARRKVARLLIEDLGLESTSGDPVEALGVGGRTPGAYSSKVKIAVDAEASAADTARRIHLELLRTMRINEDGVRRDLDSEFLHDFRVAVRRTRSALTQIKGVFPAGPMGYFKRELSWLGSLSGPTRDLDVYLLKIGDYEASLPPAVRQDLRPLRSFLVDQQRREQKKMVAGFDSERCRNLLADWQAFLEGAERGPWNEDSAEDAGVTPPNAERRTGTVASERIWKVYRKVLKRGGAIDDDSPDEALHDLRIDCKKLRYLMEFFRDLYPADDIGRLIKALKQLQDNLGDFNDYCVQQEQLRDFAQRMLDDGRGSAATLMAMGRLIERLEQGQDKERHRFHRRFERFAQLENRQRFQALFGT